jgi:hypothetical protein
MEIIRTRCPSCQKLYSVDPHLIKSSRPQFECLSCQVQFFFDFPFAGVLETPVTVVEPEKMREELPSQLANLGMNRSFLETPTPQDVVIDKECPKCGTLNRPETQECKSCKIVFQKYVEWKKEGEQWLHLNRQMSEAWRLVMDDYDNPTAHTEFFERCLEAGELPVAARRYQRILNVNPSDEIALKMRERITEFVEAPLKSSPHVHLPSWRSALFSFVILVGTLLAVTGFSVDWARNLIGVGVSLILTAIGARVYLRYLI